MSAISRVRHRSPAPAPAILLLALLALFAAAPAAAAEAEPRPAWHLSLSALPTNLAPGGQGEYLAVATNVGGAATDATPVALSVTLPAGIAPSAIIKAGNSEDSAAQAPNCEIEAQNVNCETAEPVHPGRRLFVSFKAGAAADAAGTLLATAQVGGGGASQQATASGPIEVQAEAVPFDLLPGFAAPLGRPDGAAATLAGSHPYQQTIDFGFPSRTSSPLGSSGHPRDFTVDLPRGLIGNPAATPVLCTEAQLLAYQCPDSTQVGVTDVTTLVVGFPLAGTSNLYNMVPPPGMPAELATNIADVGIFAHIETGVRTDSDYGIEATLHDILAYSAEPLLRVSTQLWGDPSAAAHDSIRGACHADNGSCDVVRQKTAFLTMPGDCSGQPLRTEVSADSWEEPSLFHRAAYESADLQGNPTTLTGCETLSYEPTIEAQPTTNVADSPSGLDVDLHQPQDFALGEEGEDRYETRATAQLRDATVTLPAGMSLNPSSANGLEACSESEVGYLGSGHYSKQPDSCPEAAKIGRVEVTTPLLDHALKGSVYVAKPYENQFDSLLAIYLSISSPRDGIYAKLAGRVSAELATGQLTTTFTENPELPLEDVKLHLFEGAGAPLRTPAVCGSYSTTSHLVPWSAPQGEDAHPSDDWPISGNCSNSASSQPNSPEFEAGAESPIAGKYTPFVVHLKREDGSQQFSKLTLTPPPGLTAKLAGTPACSDGALAAAEGKSGRDEQSSPSCPGDSKIGSVHVGAGAGPAPYYAEGAAYLAGPYKGAPLSMAIITPAVAGPYDLGTVVTRVALHVDPTTTRITADADPIPHILKGIPLDVRSIDVALDKPDFSRTGTSCDPFAVNGQLISTLGQGAALESRYQLGNCANLAFKPLLGLRLKGATKRAKNPKLIATLAAKDGEANIASTAVTLPRSAFLDQSHIRTVCTRVQFAAGAGNGAECPAGSIYGQAWARSPLLDYTLTGNAYLRSSNHKLPDLVLAFNGPAYQPIAIELSGRTDSVKGALRNTFEAVPDAPVSFFRLVLFGGKRGLVQNSRDTCAHTYRANVVFGAQNGDSLTRHPKVKAQCRKAHHKKHKRHHRRSHKRGAGHGRR